MAVLFDTNILLLVLQPNLPPALDPTTGRNLEFAEERINHLIRTLSKAKTEVLVPTPVLTEILCNAGAAKVQIIGNLQREPFKVVSFDIRASIECAELLAVNLARKTKNVKGQPGSRAKVNFDRQIVAIAKVHRVDAIYSDDEDVDKEARRIGLKVIRSFELERDPNTRQSVLDLPGSDTATL